MSLVAPGCLGDAIAFSTWGPMVYEHWHKKLVLHIYIGFEVSNHTYAILVLNCYASPILVPCKNHLLRGFEHSIWALRLRLLRFLTLGGATPLLCRSHCFHSGKRTWVWLSALWDFRFFRHTPGLKQHVDLPLVNACQCPTTCWIHPCANISVL